jgi:transcription initiation factor TFIIH subunit 4
MYRFPNLSVSVITRESTRQAFRGGITAAQIARFLRMHAHTQQQQKKKDGVDVIPPTVIDQIFLWQEERDR